MKNTISTILKCSSELKRKMAEDEAFLEQVNSASQMLMKTIKNGGTIYTCGNGGSACDAMHFVEELVARFKRERPGIKAMHMLDQGALTCWSNDYNFESVFERYVQTFCGEHDSLVLFSTSGNSANILRACQAAKASKTFSLALTGKGGGKLTSASDLALIVPDQETERIQEAHITLVHIFCEIIEQQLFS